MDWELWVVTISLSLSFIFSASETALTALGRLEINTFRALGGWQYALIRKWHYSPNKYITIVLVGNNITNITASAMLTLWLNQNYQTHVGWFLAIFTVFVIIFAEIIPKILARHFSIRVSPFAMRFLIWVGWMLYPVVYLVSYFSNQVVNLTGATGRGHAQPMSEEELTSTIQLAAREGGIDRETGATLENLIEFTDTLAKDIMTPRSKIVSLSVGDSLQDVLQKITEHRYSRYPVVKNSLDEVVGILIAKDLLAFIRRGGVGSWTRILHPATYENEMAPLGSMLKDMKRSGLHMVLIRDELGLMNGLVTLEDILEEIVGEIRDETDDPSEGGLEPAMGGPDTVSGDIPIVDFNSRYRTQLSQDLSYSTLNGYILSKTGGKIPDVGTLIIDDDFTFRIHSVSDTGIVTIELIEHH